MRSLLWGTALAFVLGGCESASIVGGARVATEDAQAPVFDAGATDVPRDVSVDTNDVHAGQDALEDVMTPADTATPRDVADAADGSAPADLGGLLDVPEDRPDVVDSGPSMVPTSVETVTASAVTAGQALVITCLARDASGSLLPLAQSQFERRVAPADRVRREGEAIFATRPGTASVACALAREGLEDSTPSTVTITAGAAAELRAVASPTSVTAGEAVTVTCTTVDSEGNVLMAPGIPPMVVMSGAVAGRVEGNRVTLEQSGAAEIACRGGGLRERVATVMVRPAGAVALRIELVPRQTRYDVGQLIIFDGLVTDRFGNLVPDVPVTWTTPPEAMVDAGSPNRLRFPSQGRYVVRARATGEGGVPLTAESQFVVDNLGPSIRCTSPASPAMLDVLPGQPITIQGTVSDPFGVRNVLVRLDGTSNYFDVPVDSNGRWTATIPAARFGLNYLEVAGYDGWGNPSLDVCTYLVASRWQPESVPMPSALGFHLTQAAVDDGAPSSPITSVNDILQRLITGPTLATQVGAALAQSNPVYNNSCAVPIPLLNTCVSGRIDVTGLELRGPNTSTVTLVQGGLRLGVVAQNVVVRVNANIGGTVYPGTMTFARISVESTFDVALVAGRARATPRPGATTVSVSTPVISLSGLPSYANDLVNGLVASSIPPLVSAALRDLLVAQMGSALDGVLSSLDVRAFGGSLAVGAFDGGAGVNLQFASALERFEATASRLSMVLSTTVSGPARRTTPSRGIALPAVNGVISTLTTPATLTLEVSLFNQVLHAMWRAGMFDTDVANVDFIGSRGTLRTRVELPPVAHLDGAGNLLVDLGAVDHTLLMLDPPIVARFGVRLRARPTIAGSSIQFGTFELAEFHFVLLNLPTGTGWNDTIQGYIRPYIQSLTGEALGRALPAVPVPSFIVPSGLSEFGIPPGTELGVHSATLTVEGQQLVIRGGFGQTTR
jgi:hypothetical protein